MAMFRTEDFKTGLCRISFAQNLFVAREQGKPPNVRRKFGATLIYPKSVLKEKVCRDKLGKLCSLEDLVRDCIVGEWGEKGLARAAKGLIKSPFLSGDGKEARNKETGDLHPGMGEDVFFVRVQANEDRPPKVSSTATGSFTPATKEDVYSGCYGFPVINAFCWHNEENGDGVSIGISVFLKHADGEPLGSMGGGGSPDAWIEKIADEGEAPASTKDGAGAGGLFG